MICLTNVKGDDVARTTRFLVVELFSLYFVGFTLNKCKNTFYEMIFLNILLKSSHSNITFFYNFTLFIVFRIHLINVGKCRDKVIVIFFLLINK